MAIPIETILFRALDDLLAVLEKSFEPSDESLRNSGWVEGRQLKDAMNKARAAIAEAGLF